MKKEDIIKLVDESTDIKFTEQLVENEKSYFRTIEYNFEEIFSYIIKKNNTQKLIVILEFIEKEMILLNNYKVLKNAINYSNINNFITILNSFDIEIDSKLIVELMSTIYNSEQENLEEKFKIIIKRYFYQLDYLELSIIFKQLTSIKSKNKNQATCKKNIIELIRNNKKIYKKISNIFNIKELEEKFDKILLEHLLFKIESF